MLKNCSTRNFISLFSIGSASYKHEQVCVCVRACVEHAITD